MVPVVGEDWLRGCVGRIGGVETQAPLVVPANAGLDGGQHPAGDERVEAAEAEVLGKVPARLPLRRVAAPRCEVAAQGLEVRLGAGLEGRAPQDAVGSLEGLPNALLGDAQPIGDGDEGLGLAGGAVGMVGEAVAQGDDAGAALRKARKPGVDELLHGGRGGKCVFGGRCRREITRQQALLPALERGVDVGQGPEAEAAHGEKVIVGKTGQLVDRADAAHAQAPIGPRGEAEHLERVCGFEGIALGL